MAMGERKQHREWVPALFADLSVQEIPCRKGVDISVGIRSSITNSHAQAGIKHWDEDCHDAVYPLVLCTVTALKKWMTGICKRRPKADSMI